MVGLPLTNPRVEYNYRTGKFKLLTDYYTPEYIIPAGYETDGATNFPVFYNLVAPTGKHFPACIVHDWLYDTGTGTKADADALFMKNLKRCGVSWHIRALMYVAVRLFGRFGPDTGSLVN